MIYRNRVGGLGQYLASPVVAGNNLILTSEEGLISVVQTDDEFKVLGQFELGESIQVTPALGRKTFYVRGKNNLWAFGSAKR
jgi:phosphoribosyl-AMP cyclohydrolase